MENKHEPESGDADLVDPLSHLALLNRSKSVSDTEAFLNFGPWWHAPLWGALIGGLALGNAGLFNSTRLVETDSSGRAVFEASYGGSASTVVLVAGVILAVDGYRRQVVKPKPTLKGFALTVLTVVIVILLTLAWNLAIFVVGYENFSFAWTLLAWASTTGFFLALIRVLGRLRESSRVAAI